MAAERDDATGLEAIKTELLAREPIFHRAALGTTRDDYLAQTADDFWEVGASGVVYERRHVIDTLVERGRVVGDETWVLSEARLRHLADETYALTYQLDQEGRLTRRLTLWRRGSDGWKILYHQGTIVERPRRQ